MATRHNKLTKAQVKNAGPGKHFDAWGLFLLVKPSGGKSWIWRGTIHGKRCELGLGSADFVSLDEARETAFQYKREARRGGDPRTLRRKTGAPTFSEAVESTIRLHEGAWTDSRTAASWRGSLRRYAGHLWERPIDGITSGDLLGVLRPIWTEKPTLSKNLLQRLRAVMFWAIAAGHRSDDPTAAVKAGLPKKNGNGVKHQPSVHYSALGMVLRQIEAADANESAKLCLVFQALTATRPSEARLMTWAEVDRESATWIIPAARTKMRRELRIPLSRQALDVLDKARELPSYGSDLVFPGRGGRPMGDATLSGIFRGLGVQAVPHGARSSFRCWAAEHSDMPRELAEHALGHVVGSAAERAYQRSDLFEQRRELMQRWADYLG